MKKSYFDLHPHEYFAYRGYLVRYNRTTESYMINKDGFFIGWAKSPENAERIINQLVSPYDEVVNPDTIAEYEDYHGCS